MNLLRTVLAAALVAHALACSARNPLRAGSSNICGRLLLVHGAALRRSAGRHLHDLRLHGGNQEKSQL